MIEYLAGTGALLTILFTLFFKVGAIESKVNSIEKNFTEAINECKMDIKWTRNFLITQKADPLAFLQQSPIQINEMLEKKISSEWKRKISELDCDVSKCNSAFDCIVLLSDKIGEIALRKEAEKSYIDYASFLLASGIYLFNRKKEMN